MEQGRENDRESRGAKLGRADVRKIIENLPVYETARPGNQLRHYLLAFASRNRRGKKKASLLRSTPVKNAITVFTGRLRVSYDRVRSRIILRIRVASSVTPRADLVR